MALDFERAGVIADDLVADRESRPRPSAHRLGREEGIEPQVLPSLVLSVTQKVLAVVSRLLYTNRC